MAFYTKYWDRLFKQVEVEWATIDLDIHKTPNGKKRTLWVDYKPPIKEWEEPVVFRGENFFSTQWDAKKFGEAYALWFETGLTAALAEKRVKN